MDPFSLTTGVLGLLAICSQVGVVLKVYLDAVDFIDDKIKGIQATVQSFIQVLTLMENTLKQDDIQTSLRATGHISNHWRYLSASIRDGQEILTQLRKLLETVNKSASVLSGARKHKRLQDAAEEIASYQQQIQGYKDTLQLSLQTVTLSKQVTLQESTDRILPKLEEVEQEVRRMAFSFRQSMTKLQMVIESETGEGKAPDEYQNKPPRQLQTLESLMGCVHSAATIVSDASTTLGLDQGRGGSDFGDCFPPPRNEDMLRWIEDNTIREDHPESDQSIHQRRESTGRAYAPPMSDMDDSDSDTDTDLKEEIIHSLVAKGKHALAEKDFTGAESYFFNGLNRTKELRISSDQTSNSVSELIQLLLATYRAQGKLLDAKSLLIDSIHRDHSDIGLLSDILSLGEALFQQEDYPNALICGKRALKAYHRLGAAAEKESVLHMLIKVCKAQGNIHDLEGFEAMLSHPQSQPRRATAPARPDMQRSRPARRLSYGKPLDFEHEPSLTGQQSQRSNSSDLLGPIGEGQFFQWGGSPPPLVSNITTQNSSPSPRSEGQPSTSSPSSVTTPEHVGNNPLNRRMKTGVDAGSKALEVLCSGSISDLNELLLPLRPGYFDSEPQPTDFMRRGHVQSWASTSTGLGDLAHIDSLEKEMSGFSDPFVLLKQTAPITGWHGKANLVDRKASDSSQSWTVPTKGTGMNKALETSDGSWLDKEVDKEILPQIVRRHNTMPDISPHIGFPIKLNRPTSKKAKIFKKVVVVGDSKSGKTPLLSRIARKHCPEDPPPTQWDTYNLDIELDGEEIELAIWELGAHDKEGLVRLRSSPKMDAFLVCFSIDCYESLAQVNKRGHHVAELIKAEKYLECSAKTGEGVKEVLDVAVRLTLQGQKKKGENNKQKKNEGKSGKGSEETRSARFGSLLRGKA